LVLEDIGLSESSRERMVNRVRPRAGDEGQEGTGVPVEHSWLQDLSTQKCQA
jgi:hypothetical protein